MSDNKISRRGFLSRAISSGMALSGIVNNYSCSKLELIDNKIESTALLGHTGVRIPRISLGLGSRFCNVQDEEEALQILNYALDNGLTSWDTAHNYVGADSSIISEERVGNVLKNRRNEVFLTTKIFERDYDAAMKQIEISLKRLQTDYIDNLMIHSVNSINDVEIISKKGGIIDLFTNLKHQGVTRFIGFSGHNSAPAMSSIIDRGDFDTMLIAMNHFTGESEQREELVIPKALEKGLGILLMKVIRPKENLPGFEADELIRYSLSLEGVTGIVLGIDSLAVVKSNIEILRSIVFMTKIEKDNMFSDLKPFFNNRGLDWLQEDYKDGIWD